MFSIRCKSRFKREEIKNDPQTVTKIKPFINKYDWEGMHFPSQKDDQKKFEKNNVTVPLNVLYAKKALKGISIILLMIPTRTVRGLSYVS